MKRLLGLLPALIVVACTSAGSDSEGPREDDLIGGAEATTGQFPTTLNIRGNCTVAKVGPRHILTAAHCVVTEYGVDDPLRYDFRPGSILMVSNRAVLNQVGTDDDSLAAYKKVVIKQTHVHPGYAELANTAVPVVGFEVPPDVAIIELDEASADTIANLPEASIDLTPVKPGDPLVIMGYGCESGVEGAKDYAKSRLKFRNTAALGLDSQLHAGSSVYALDSERARRLEKQYVFTPGASTTAAAVAPADAGAESGAENASDGAPRSEEASLCPGDSGGPVYRGDGSSRVIVGVNAYYSFREQSVDPSRISVTNWHTRLDAESRYDTGSWIASIEGVKLTGLAPTNHFSKCTDVKKAVCGTIAESRTKIGAASFGPPGASPRYELVDNTWTWTQSFQNKRVTLEPVTNEVKLTDLVDETRCGPNKNGKYCGVTLGDPESKTLYTCAAGQVKERVFCSTVCQSNPSGVPDACAAEGWRDFCAGARKDGRYCGGALGDTNTKALYQCAGKQTLKKIECSKACSPQPSGVPDKCKP
jgi:hypothetical protein